MTNKIKNTPSPEGIAAAARAATKSRTLPPVMSWNPPSILKIEDGKYFLVTPVEKVGIQVDDAPFIAVDFNEVITQGEKALEFETNVGDQVVASNENPIRVERDAITDEPAPYIHIRNGLDALIDRKTFYRLIDIGQHRNHENEDWFGIISASTFFPIIKSEELENSI